MDTVRRLSVICGLLALCLTSLASAQTVRSDDFNRPPGPLVTANGNWGQQATYGGNAVIRNEVTGDPLTGVVGTNNKLTIAYWRELFGLEQFSAITIAPGFDPQNALQAFVNRRAPALPPDQPNRYAFMFNPLAIDCGQMGCYQIKYDGGPNAPVLASVPGVQYQPGDVVGIDHAIDGTLRGFVNGVVVVAVNVYATVLAGDPLQSGVAGMTLGPLTGTTILYAIDAWRGGQGLYQVN